MNANTELFKADESESLIKNKRDELEHLCYIYKLMIEDKTIGMNKQNIAVFEKTIKEMIDWVYSVFDVNNNPGPESEPKPEPESEPKAKPESEPKPEPEPESEPKANAKPEPDYTECANKITELNELFDSLTNADKADTNQNPTQTLAQTEPNQIHIELSGHELVPADNNNKGTSIFDIARLNQESILEDMINS